MIIWYIWVQVFSDHQSLGEQEEKHEWVAKNSYKECCYKNANIT